MSSFKEIINEIPKEIILISQATQFLPSKLKNYGQNVQVQGSLISLNYNYKNTISIAISETFLREEALYMRLKFKGNINLLKGKNLFLGIVADEDQESSCWYNSGN